MLLATLNRTPRTRSRSQGGTSESCPLHPGGRDTEGSRAGAPWTDHALLERRRPASVGQGGGGVSPPWPAATPAPLLSPLPGPGGRTLPSPRTGAAVVWAGGHMTRMLEQNKRANLGLETVRYSHTGDKVSSACVGSASLGKEVFQPQGPIVTRRVGCSQLARGGLSQQGSPWVCFGGRAAGFTRGRGVRRRRPGARAPQSSSCPRLGAGGRKAGSREGPDGNGASNRPSQQRALPKRPALVDSFFKIFLYS